MFIVIIRDISYNTLVYSNYSRYLENSSSVHTDTRKKISFGECPAQGLDDTSITAEAKFSINFTESGKSFVLSLSYNGNNRFLFVNATKLYQFKAKHYEIKSCPLCLENISKDFTANNLRKQKQKKNIKWNDYGYSEKT